VPVRAKQRLHFEEADCHDSSMGTSLSRQGSMGRPPRPAESSGKRKAALQSASTEQQPLPAKKHCSTSATPAELQPVQAKDTAPSAQYLSDEENDAGRANSGAERMAAAAVALDVSLAASPVQQVAAGAHIPKTPATADRTRLLPGQGAGAWCE
jgi:hypothetical protein